ncbi:MAG: cell division protein FtsZ [Wenyingzhuangia sp.]
MSDTPFNNVAFDMPKTQSSSIKVIGVGGGGSNAVNHMFSQDIKGVDFVICNTDAQALQNSPVPNKIQLGVSLTSGLGAGANPEVGEKAAQESIEEIRKMLTSQTKMVFITAGMGGGTGTGAAPIIASIAKKMDILTVGIVTIPFQFEGRMRAKQAQKGVDELRENVDSLIVVNNNKLREVYGNLGFKAGFSKADEVLSTASRGIAEVITHHYKQNIDLHDAKAVLSNSGTAIMGSSKEAGENRAQNAIMKALDSPLLNDNKIRGAKNVLLLIVSGEAEVTLDEIGEINDFIQQEAGYEANIIMGVGEDDALGDALSVTVVATGFAIDQQKDITNTEVKKVYHTLNTEQTAHYNFEEEKPYVKKEINPIARETAGEEKVVHQLFEDEEDVVFAPRKTTDQNFEDATIAVHDIEVEFEEVLGEVKNEDRFELLDENEFIINDVTPDLFSTAEDESSAEENVFDLPINAVKEVKLEESIDVFELPVIDAETVIFESKQPEAPRTVYVLEDDEKVEDIEVIEAKEIHAKPEFVQEPTGVKKYTLEQFDAQPTIKNASSIKMNSVHEIEVNEAEEITMEVRESQPKKLVPKNKNEEVSPLNLTISEVHRSAEKRKNTFKKYNYKFKNSTFTEDVIDEMEREPAYKRLGLELHNKQEMDNKSRTSVDVDENNGITIRKNNSFLHDNVD